MNVITMAGASLSSHNVIPSKIIHVISNYATSLIYLNQFMLRRCNKVLKEQHNKNKDITSRSSDQMKSLPIHSTKSKSSKTPACEVSEATSCKCLELRKQWRTLPAKVSIGTRGQLRMAIIDYGHLSISSMADNSGSTPSASSGTWIRI